jgi:hypothetical protein
MKRRISAVGFERSNFQTGEPQLCGGLPVFGHPFAYKNEIGEWITKRDIPQLRICDCGEHWVADVPLEKPVLEIEFEPFVSLHVSAACRRKLAPSGDDGWITSLAFRLWKEAGMPEKPGQYGELVIHSVFPTWEGLGIQASILY